MRGKIHLIHIGSNWQRMQNIRIKVIGGFVETGGDQKGIPNLVHHKALPDLCLTNNQKQGAPLYTGLIQSWTLNPMNSYEI